MGTTVMYTRELQKKDFNEFYPLLLKAFAERGFVDTSFDREQVNVEARRCMIALDHSVIGLFADDVLKGFAIIMYGQEIYNKDRYVQIDMIHTDTDYRRDIHLQRLIEQIKVLAKKNECNKIKLNNKGLQSEQSVKDLLYIHNQFFQTDQIWEAEL
jgi:hypothetical protein